MLYSFFSLCKCYVSTEWLHRPEACCTRWCVTASRLVRELSPAVQRGQYESDAGVYTQPSLRCPFDSVEKPPVNVLSPRSFLSLEPLIKGKCQKKKKEAVSADSEIGMKHPEATGNELLGVKCWWFSFIIPWNQVPESPVCAGPCADIRRPQGPGRGVLPRSTSECSYH